jgi:hypothetical protein
MKHSLDIFTVSARVSEATYILSYFSDFGYTGITASNPAGSLFDRILYPKSCRNRVYGVSAGFGYIYGIGL